MKYKKGRKPKEQPIFENEEYRITKIPLNWAVDVKVMVKGTKGRPSHKLLSEPLYTSLEAPLKEVHELARYMINKYQNGNPQS